MAGMAAFEPERGDHFKLTFGLFAGFVQVLQGHFKSFCNCVVFLVVKLF